MKENKSTNNEPLSINDDKIIDRRPDSQDADLLSSLVLFCFACFVFISGLYMCFSAQTGTEVWYYSPGFFPLFIGAVLLILAILFFRKKYIAGGRLKHFTGIIRNSINTNKTLRLCLAIGIFAFYVFVLIGRIHFLVATFIYLFVTMTVFRTENYAIWKIAIISASATGFVYLFFGIIASVPLP